MTAVRPWQSLAEVKAPAHASSNPAYSRYVSNWTNPYLYVLPQAVVKSRVRHTADGYGRIGATTTTISTRRRPIRITRRHTTATAATPRSRCTSSTDSGATWNVVNIIATGSWSNGANYPATENTYHQNDPVWEPYLMVYNNQLIAYYSDENDYTGYNSTTGVPNARSEQHHHT
ncbi:hypothetical protein ACRAWF_15465 [Streptomyces sp. L7]